MSLHIYIAGLLEVSGDNVGLQLSSVGSTGQMALVCDSGERTAEEVAVNAAPGCEVSTNGVTFGPAAVFPAGSIADIPVPCYVKRTQAFVGPDTWRVGTTSPRLSLVKTEAIPAAPAAPNAFTPSVTDITSSGALVTFGTTDRNGDELTYKVAVTTSAAPPSTWTMADSVSPLAVTGLNPFTTYYAHVRAFDGTFATISSPAMFETSVSLDTTAPVIAGTLSAINTGPAQVAISGPTATDANGIGKWQRQTDGGAWIDVASTSTTFPTTNVPSLPVGLHTFAVRALDPAGNISATSNVASAIVSIWNSSATPQLADAFDRADSATIGNGWTQFVSAGFVSSGIVGNKLGVVAPADTTNRFLNICRAYAGGDSRVVEVKVTDPANFYLYPGISAAFNGTGSTYGVLQTGYVLIINAGYPQMMLRKFNAGTPTTIVDYTSIKTPVVGDRVAIERDGNIWRVYINGVQVGTDVTDATYTNLGYVGAVLNTATSGKTCSFDDFRIYASADYPGA